MNPFHHATRIPTLKYGEKHMEMDMTEWGFVPTAETVGEALATLWAPRSEWGMGDPDFDLEAGGDGDDHVCVWPA